MIDLAIVGGGAAGISAAREARKRGLQALLIEASDRLGGRARTLDWRGHKLDLGATWMHSAGRNPLASLAQEIGVPIDAAPTSWRTQYGQLGFSAAEQAEAWTAMETFAERLRAGPQDDNAVNALEAGNPWNGFLEAMNGYLNGTSLANTSAEDFIAFWDGSDGHNWRLPGGYGALVVKLGQGLEARTGCAVDRIEWSASGVRVHSSAGVMEAGKAIIAIPTEALAAGAIAFNPALDERLHAAAQLPLGTVEKMFFSIADPESAPDNAHLSADPRSAQSGSYMLRPMGMPVIEGFFGGDWLEGVTADDLAAKARAEFGHLLGSDFARQLEPIAYSDWQRHPHICGSYSYAVPGQHSARAALRAPIDGPVAFAGEALSDEDFATVHAAWASGIAALEQLFGAV